MMPEHEMNASELKRMLDEDRDRRIKECNDEVTAVLERHGVQLIAVPVITNDGRIAAQPALRLKEPA
jgi:Flp pilus assembly secretin CpaC